MAEDNIPFFVMTSTSTVGLPRESKIYATFNIKATLRPWASDAITYLASVNSCNEHGCTQRTERRVEWVKRKLARRVI